MTELARLTAIAKSFGGVRALRGVDFDVQSGEVHALIGENGAGKSTLMRVLGGEMPPSSGEIRDRRQARRASWARGRRAPMASPSSIRSWRSRRICRWRRIFSSANCRASSRGAPCAGEPRELIALARLRHRSRPAGRQPRGRASAGGGDRQGAVAQGQDHRVRRADRGACPRRTPSACTKSSRELRAEGVGIVYISHRLEEVLSISDRVTVMKDGQVVATTTAAEAHNRRDDPHDGWSSDGGFVSREGPADDRRGATGGPRSPGRPPRARRERSRCAPARSSASAAWSGPAEPRSRG